MKFSNADEVKGYVESTNRREIDKAKFIQRMKELREKIDCLYEDGLGYVLGNDTRMKELLDITARFPGETVKNMVLIHAQKKDASYLKTAYDWEKARVAVSAGTQPILLSVKQETISKKDGKTVTYWNPAEMIDAADTSVVIRQTTPVQREPQECLKALIAVAAAQKVKLSYSDKLPEGVTALYDPGSNNIRIREGIAGLKLFEAAVFELCHCGLYLGDRGYDRTPTTNFEAYAASYIIYQRLGLPVDGFQFEPDMFTAFSWKEFEPQIKAIIHTGSDISKALVAVLDRENQQQERQPAEKAPLEAERREGGVMG